MGIGLNLIILNQIDKKYLFYIISFISVLFVLIYNHDLSADIKSHEQKYANFDHDLNDYRVVDSNEWIFNYNVTQYSSILIGGEWDQDIIIESLVFFDNLKTINDNFQNDIKCFVISNYQGYLVDLIEMKLIRLMYIDFFPKFLFKCTCKLNRTIHKNNFNHINMAIVDITYFYYYKGIFFNNELLLSLQKPDFINITLSKKKQVANCVHMLARIDDATSFNKVNDWLSLQREIGFAKIKLYLFNIDEIYVQKLRLNYGNEFIDLKKHSTSIEDVCNWQIKLLSEDGKNSIKRFLYENCQRAYKLHFKMSDTFVYNSHERLNTNDCYMRFRHQYEYVTNYDIDEIIFPRLLPTHQLNLNKCNEFRLLNNSQLIKYNIYDFTEKLFNKYGADTAYLHFHHVIFFDNTYKFSKDILTINDQIDRVFIYTFSNNNEKKIIYKIVDQNDTIKINNYKNLIPIVNCLNETFMDSSKFDKWNNLYASKMDFRSGKSIFKTNYTLLIDQHIGVEVKPSTLFHNVSLADGYVTHVRDNLNGFPDVLNFPFEFIIFDLEYYSFILSVSDKQ
jgi:hypothetical protein